VCPMFITGYFTPRPPSPFIPTAVELSQLRRIWSAEFIPLPADLHVPRGGGLKSALLDSTAVPFIPLPARCTSLACTSAGRGANATGNDTSWYKRKAAFIPQLKRAVVVTKD